MTTAPRNGASGLGLLVVDEIAESRRLPARSAATFDTDSGERSSGTTPGEPAVRHVQIKYDEGVPPTVDPHQRWLLNSTAT